MWWRYGIFFVFIGGVIGWGIVSVGTMPEIEVGTINQRRSYFATPIQRVVANKYTHSMLLARQRVLEARLFDWDLKYLYEEK